MNIGCDISARKFDDLRKENESLKTEIINLKKELEELKFGANHLFNIGKKEFEEGDFESAKKTFETLLEKHPDSREAIEAKKFIDKSIFEIKRKNEIEKAKKEQEENEKKRHVANATKKMSKDYDELEAVTWYKDSSFQQYLFDNHHPTNIQLYFGQQDKGFLFLRLKIEFFDDHWLFIKSFFVIADGQRFEHPFITFERGVITTSLIMEWYDVEVSNNNIAMVKAIIKSKKATIRLQGDPWQRDHRIEAVEKKAMQNVIDAFEALGGKI